MLAEAVGLFQLFIFIGITYYSYLCACFREFGAKRAHDPTRVQRTHTDGESYGGHIERKTVFGQGRQLG